MVEKILQNGDQAGVNTVKFTEIRERVRPRRGQLPYVALLLRPGHDDLIQHLLTGESLHQAGTLFCVVCFRIEVGVGFVDHVTDPIDQAFNFVAVMVGIHTNHTFISALYQEIRPSVVPCEIQPPLLACLLSSVPDAARQMIITEMKKVLIGYIAEWEGNPGCVVLRTAMQPRILVLISKRPTNDWVRRFPQEYDFMGVGQAFPPIDTCSGQNEVMRSEMRSKVVWDTIRAFPFRKDNE